MEKDQLAKEVFRSVDNFDSQKFSEFFTSDGVFRFGNMPEVKGQKNIYEFVHSFFNGIKSAEHSDIESWQDGDVIIVNGKVHYTRHDGSVLSVPFSNTWKMKGEKIDKYYIFIDNSELFS
jgi:ketosteroid isomerase-like protein